MTSRSSKAVQVSPGEAAAAWGQRLRKQNAQHDDAVHTPKKRTDRDVHVANGVFQRGKSY